MCDSGRMTLITSVIETVTFVFEARLEPLSILTPLVFRKLILNDLCLFLTPCFQNLFTDKIIVGSFMGYLRIFNPHSVKTGGGPQAEDLLLEVHLRDPVLQVEVGKFVS